MKIDIEKLETLQNLLDDPEKIIQRVGREGELFLLENNHPQMVLLTFEKYNEIKKSLEDSIRPELNIRSIREGKFSDDYENKAWGKKWDLKETQATLYYYLVVCKNKPEYENKKSLKLQSFVKRVNKFMNNNRSVNSYALKIQNFQSLNEKDPRSGLINASNQDRRVWDEYSQNITELKPLYDEIMNDSHIKVRNETSYNDLKSLLEDFKLGNINNNFLEDYLSSYKIGRIAENFIKFLIENKIIDEEVIKKMQTEFYSKKIFDLQYPILTTRPPQTNPKRYYAKPVLYNGIAYYVCSEWYESDREYLLDWIKKINN